MAEEAPEISIFVALGSFCVTQLSRTPPLSFDFANLNLWLRFVSLELHWGSQLCDAVGLGEYRHGVHYRA